MKKIIVIILAFLLLPGCISTAIVAGAAAGAAGGSIIYDHRSAKTMLDDRDITFNMQQELDHDKQLNGHANLSVASFNHIVLLVGQAPNSELRNRAEEILKSHTKIKMLYNEITIEKPISDIASANDSWITTKVKALLLATPGLNSATLKVVTENSVVYLMGLTTRSQAEIATDKARSIAGVQKIVKLFEYLN
jgi:osmotically-inducible protein OsmY